MNKYLEKIAEEKKKNQPFGYAVAGGATAVTLEPHLRGIAGQASMGKIHGRIHAPHRRGETNLHTIKHYLKASGLKGDVLLDPGRKDPFSKIKSSGSTPHFNYKDLVHTQTGVRRSSVRNIKGVHPDIIMHELGHAKDYSRHIGPKALLNKTYASKHGRMGFGMAGSALLTDKQTENYAPALAAVPGLAQMRSEGAANMHAFRGIKAHKGIGAANKFLARTALPNMAHYGASNAVAPAIAALLLMAKKYSRKNGTLDE
jgi:hypothetical protein